MTEVKKEHQKFTGNGLNFKAKLVGIAEVAYPHGDAMCQQTLTSLKESAANARIQAKEHKKRIIINLTFEYGLRVLDERTKATEFQHRMETVAFVCHDGEDDRVFCYIASVGAGKHFLYAIKTAQPAAGAVNGIGELISAIMERNQIPLDSSESLSIEQQPMTARALVTDEEEDDGVNVIKVKARMPSTSSSESDFDDDPQKVLEEEDSQPSTSHDIGDVPSNVSPETSFVSVDTSDSPPQSPSETITTTTTTTITTAEVSPEPNPSLSEEKTEDLSESIQVEAFGVEVFIPKKSGTRPKPLNQKKPSLDDDIAKYTFGLEYRAKLIGVEVLGVNTGDKMKMCEDALERLKAELASTKESKTRITVDVSLEGIRIMEEKSRRLLYFHKVHQLVFIAFDIKEPRGCGYIADTGTKFHFVGVKSMEKSSANLVGALQELIALSFEVKVQQLMQAKQKTQEDELMIQDMKVRSASYRSMVGLPEESSAPNVSELTVEERDPEEVKKQLESLQELMDKGDALVEGYNNYEEKIQEHEQETLPTSTT